MATNFNDQNTVLEDDMKKAMPIIYGELRELFFSHAPRRLPRFEGFDAPEIKLSDEIKQMSLGQYSIVEAMEKIEPIMVQIRKDDRFKVGWLEDVVNCLEQIIENCKCGVFKEKRDFEGLLRELLGILDEVKTEGGKAFDNDIYKKIIEAIDILKNIKRTEFVAGEFIVESNLIMLYPKGYGQCSGYNTLKNRMLATLAHELFHAMHCSVKGKNKWNKKPVDAREKVDARKKVDARETAVESLARWAEYCWCKHQKKADFENIANDLKKEWKVSDFPSDPYSGAKVFDNEGVIDLDIEVLDDSIKSWNKAYRKMESHRNDKPVKRRMDIEAEKLYKRLIRGALNCSRGIKGWAIIHPHDLNMSEWHNLKTCELVQYELEQRGLAVTRIPCKARYFTRNNEPGWGNSALLFIIDDEVNRKDFLKDLESVANKYVNTQNLFLDAEFWSKNYYRFDEDSILSIFQDIFSNNGAIRPN